MDSDITIRGVEAATAVQIYKTDGSPSHASVVLHDPDRGWHTGRVTIRFGSFNAACRVADAINDAVDMDRSPVREAAE